MEITIKINQWQMEKLIECQDRINNNDAWSHRQDLDGTLNIVLEKFLKEVKIR